VPEGEALSWLLLGRGPGASGTGQLAALPLATDALTGSAGSRVAKALHVDDIGVRSADTGTTSQQFFTLGKRLSERFYVAFEQSIGGAESLLRLEYTLTQRILLRLQAGAQESSLGVIYRYIWD
jgi:translocation and assembly module TamB